MFGIRRRSLQFCFGFAVLFSAENLAAQQNPSLGPTIQVPVDPQDGATRAWCTPILITRAGETTVDHATPLLQCVVADPRQNDNQTRVSRTNSSVEVLLARLSDGDGEVVEDVSWVVHEGLDLPFGLASLEGMGGVARWVRFYASEGRGRMNSYLARAGRYRALIEEELAAADAPKDLLWVVAIESNFDPTAGSHAGAAGLWQFMARTAQSRGLRVDREVDERYDVVRSTREAISYLMMQKERFGSWPLALAAYNAGSGHVRSSIRAHEVTELDAMARRGVVYQDARSYAAKIIAIGLIARNAKYFGFDGVVPERPIEWDVVRVDDNVRLSLIADAAGVSAAEVIALNPALRTRTVPRGGAEVRIPKGTFQRFVHEYDRVASRYGKEHSIVPLRFGESVANVARREGIPERVLRAVNGFSSSDRIPYGTELIVPESSRRTEESSTQRTSAKPVVVVAEREFAYENRKRIFYQTLAHDTLREIAEFFQVSHFQLAAWNELDPSATLWGGMMLQIYVADDFDHSGAVVFSEDEVQVLRIGTPEWSAWRQSDESTSASQPAPRRQHKVKAGDTVLGIANRYGVDPQDIVRWNRLRDSAHIVIGQELWVSPR